MQFYALCSSSNAKKKIAHIFKLPITLLGVLKANFFRFSRLSVIIIILLLEKIVHSCFFKLISAAALLWLCQTNEKLLKNAPNPVPKRHGGKNTSHVICEKWTSFKKHTFFRSARTKCVAFLNLLIHFCSFASDHTLDNTINFTKNALYLE